MNVYLTDWSHTDRPSVHITATEVITSHDGVILRGCSIDPRDCGFVSYPCIADLISAVWSDGDIVVSHDWSVECT